MKTTAKNKQAINIEKIISFPGDLWRHLNPTIRVILVLFILLNVLGFGTTFYLNRQNLPAIFQKTQPNGGQPQAAASPRPTKPPLPKDYDLKISDQRAGITLTVDTLTSPKNGWFVVYKDANGKPGELLEEAIPPFEGGTYENIVFILRTPLLLGQKYFAVLHTEDGDEAFRFPKSDQEALNSKGEKVMQQFAVK